MLLQDSATLAAQWQQHRSLLAFCMTSGMCRRCSRRQWCPAHQVLAAGRRVGWVGNEVDGACMTAMAHVCAHRRRRAGCVAPSILDLDSSSLHHASLPVVAAPLWAVCRSRWLCHASKHAKHPPPPALVSVLLSLLLRCVLRHALCVLCGLVELGVCRTPSSSTFAHPCGGLIALGGLAGWRMLGLFGGC